MTQDPGRRESTAGAWAAAALVFALGGLGFGVAAQLRINDLQHRVDRLDARLEAPARPLEPSVTTASTTTSPALSSTVSGGEEPSDVDAAKDLIATAFSTVYRAKLSNGARLALVDDPSGVDAALTAAASGPNAAIINVTTARVDDITFTSPTRATVQYSVLVPGQTPGSPRSGEARLSSGTWKVTRATVCADLAAVDAPCR